MKQLLTILLLLPWGLQAQETCDTDYRSPRIHYYVSCPDGSDTRRQTDPGQAVRAGSEAMTAAAKAHEAEWCAALVQRTLGGEAAQ